MQLLLTAIMPAAQELPKTVIKVALMPFDCQLLMQKPKRINIKPE